MRKILAISLISLHLFGNTELAQVFNVPDLLRHYHEHQREEHGISFFSFLVEHYSSNHAASNDHQHTKLPFHNFHHACITISATAVVNFNTEIEHPEFPTASEFSHFRNSSVPDAKTEVILQPPRSVC